MSAIKVTVLCDGERAAHDVTAGSTAGQLLRELPDVVAARIGSELRDLSALLDDGDEIEPVAIDSPDGRAILRHSAAHVLAQAVQQLFPEAKLGIGPPIENGFYYDFDVPEPFKPEDLERIETRMRKVIKEGQRFVRRVVSDHDARAELAGEPYKLELIGLKGMAAAQAAEGAEAEVGHGELSIYDNTRRDGSLAWKDLCRGPHLPTTKRIPAFTLTRSAAAYWRGDENNPQLQRIYGTAWESKEALQAHLLRLEEAVRRDHRRLGAELDLFSFPEELGSGLVVFHPKGGVVRKEMEDYARRRHEEAGYEFVYTPHLAKSGLFETSGHLQWYADGMYPAMEMEGARYYPKPMNCPGHILIYRARGRSYRELPLRLFEFGTVYRDELASLLDFVLGLLRDFGLSEFELELALRDDSDKYAGDPAQWAEAERALRAALEAVGMPYVEAPGEANFYAPKIDVHVRDAIGRRWQMSTLQVDLQLPQRFELEYQADDGSRQVPYMIHRALFGSIERFFGILTEHYAGAFPPWLAPVQVVAIPVAERHVPHLRGAADQLRAAGVRVEVDASDERMQKKIRTAQTDKVPYMLLAGDRDVEDGAVSFRYRSGEQKNGVPIDLAVTEIVDAVRRRAQV